MRSPVFRNPERLQLVLRAIAGTLGAGCLLVLLLSARSSADSPGVKIQEFRNGKLQDVRPITKTVVGSAQNPPALPPRAAYGYGMFARQAGGVQPRVLETHPDTDDLRKTVAELRRSLQTLKKSIHQTGSPSTANAPQTLPPGTIRALPPRTPNPLQYVVIEEDVHFPGDSARRFARAASGRLRRVRVPSPREVAVVAAPPEAPYDVAPVAATRQAPRVPSYENYTKYGKGVLKAPERRTPTPAVAMTSSRRQGPQTPGTPPLDPAKKQPAEQLPPPGEPEAVPLAALKEPKKIGDVKIDISLDGEEFPMDVAALRFKKAGEITHGVGASRNWGESAFAWEPGGVAHRPLYFEEVNLERHGYSAGLLQPALSAAHFFGRVPTLPYQWVAMPQREVVYTLGHYRPGSYAPYQHYWPPLSVKGGLFEAGVVTGLIFLLP